MDRLPPDEMGENSDKRVSSRPAGSNILLLTLLLLSVVFLMLIFRALETPNVDYSPFITEMEKGNVKEFQYLSESGVGKLRSVPLENVEVKVVEDEKKAADGTDDKNTTEEKPAPKTEIKQVTPEAWKIVALRKNTISKFVCHPV